jgi:hypothetical protein
MNADSNESAFLFSPFEVQSALGRRTSKGGTQGGILPREQMDYRIVSVPWQTVQQQVRELFALEVKRRIRVRVQ